MRRRPLQEVRSDERGIVEAVRDELSGSGSNIGYRRIHRALVSKGNFCRREDVRRIIKCLDPDGVELRKRRRLHRRKYTADGPNFVWHIDGHDKLKPFGFSIHGCIDGFSRMLIWLKVATTNKMPEVVAKFYIDAVHSLEGIPLQIKADDGTEHALIEPIHLYLSSLTEDSEVNHFSIITSTRNQRIESYWSTLQRDRLGWWRRFFQDLVDLNLLDTDDPVVLDCIRYCFMPVLKQELCSIKEDWNAHIISRSRNGGPSGRPNCLYHLPHLFQSQDYIRRVEINEIDEFNPVVDNLPSDFSDEFSQFAEILITDVHMNTPKNACEALHLYLYLLENIEQYS